MCVYVCFYRFRWVWFSLVDATKSIVHTPSWEKFIVCRFYTYIYLHLWMNHARYQLNMDKLSAVLQLNVSLNELIWLDVSVVAVAYRCLAGAWWVFCWNHQLSIPHPSPRPIHRHHHRPAKSNAPEVQTNNALREHNLLVWLFRNKSIFVECIRWHVNRFHSHLYIHISSK